ncbi:hypothetical protein BEWA_032270 [Theileria equi strain WA]|uniref:Topoisomerase 6 subunit A/Spo11 TOPRIM domain-containing protein n=1 Tax=Theileria equi strain WA TaxID=1537102 RepID=L0AZR1_THEEQ|nr:hypothetical protein BEWA_032270 [Theileria equi strain WA]AFZ80374.1 hypothetical protein BEWA_032270 [Theileria equi strain WA]|eukprot:XP_004830040.1 hypothetical protein BEWA_032270 [Theileria equi strain WA]
MIAGSIEFITGEDRIDVATKYYGVNITYDMLSFKANLKANHVLVVEKYTVFMSLCHSRIWKKLPIILITGCGFPSNNTRKLVEDLSMNSDIEICYLGDYDPHGFLIFLSYAKGSVSTRINSLIPDVHINRRKGNRYKWIGIRASDVEEYGIKKVVDLTKREMRILENLISDPEVAENTLLRHEIEQQRTVQKIEIEALEESTSTGVLFEYVIRKILSREWIEF